MNQKPEKHPDSENSPHEEIHGDDEIHNDYKEIEENIPEEEILTPELVEDEAIRGDFVLRWALVLVAILVSFTEISDSRTLVQIRSGQYIANHGFLPPATDIFSYSLKDESWINLAWLHDLLIAGIYSVSGMNGITILKATVVAFTFYFATRISISGISTWWGTICGSLALIACYPQLTARPEMITLLGISFTLYSLFRWQETESKRHLFRLLPAYLIWANTDPRMFIGPIILIFFTLGHVIDLFSGRMTKFCLTSLLQVGLIAIASLAVSIIHPFGWNTLLSPMHLYSKIYPAIYESLGSSAGIYQLQFDSILSAQFWSPLNPHSAAGFILVFTAIITFFLNRSKLQYSYVFVFVAIFIFAGAGSHEFTSLALVSAIIATLNAQQWYKDNFKQTYSIETGELLFSRGGRSLTVIALFILAYMGIAGSLAGSLNRRIGIGIHPDLKNYMTSFEEAIENSYDDRPFNFRPIQGDILIWHGQKVFIDNRMELYSQTNRTFLKNYQKIRFSLLRKNRDYSKTESNVALDNPYLGDSKIWKKTFSEFEITHILPRLEGRTPDYKTFRDLILNKDWSLTRITPATAVFYRSDLKNNKSLNQYLIKNNISFIKNVFRSEDTQEPTSHLGWAKEPGSFINLLARPNQLDLNSESDAKHHSYLLNFPFQDSSRVSIAHHIIRKANRSLRKKPDNANSYRILGGAYLSLAQVESSIAKRANAVYELRRRYIQTVQALNQSLILNPEQPNLLLGLGQIYFQNKKYDLSVKANNRALKLLNRKNSNKKELQQLSIRTQKMEEYVDKTITEIKKSLKKNLSPVTEAQAAYQKGCVLHAKFLIELNQELFNKTPELKVFQAHVLMETDAFKQAYLISSELEQIALQHGIKNWSTQAAYANLGLADYEKSISIWKKEATILEQEQVFNLIQSTPLVSFQIKPVPTRQWPINQTISSVNALYTSSEGASSHWFNAALSYLESGQNKEAEKLLKRILTRSPETPLRPLVRFYLFQVTGKWVDHLPPTERIPINTEMFHSASQESSKK